MKIAIVFFGLSRTFKQTSKFIKIKNYFDVDFYGHTWAQNKNEKLYLETELKNTYEGNFKISLYKEHFHRLGSLLKINNTIKNNIKNIYNLNQWRSLELSIRQIQKNIRYDLIICARYDVISEILYCKDRLNYFINFFKEKKGINNNSFTNLGKKYYPMLDDFIFVGDNESIRKFGAGFTKKNIHRLLLNNNLVTITNPLEKNIFNRLNSDQNQYRIIWFEKTVQDNINLYHHKNKTLIFRPGCPVEPSNKQPTDQELSDIYNYCVEYDKNNIRIAN